MPETRITSKVEPNALRRLLARIERYSVPEPNSGCVLWIGELNGQDYARIPVGSHKYGKRRRILVHRFMFELANGPLHPGLEPDHKCRVRCCIEPNHMEAVTRSLNTKRGWDALSDRSRPRRAPLKTRCAHGHPLSGRNLYVTADGRRHCRTCALRRGREHRARSK